ncbi:unnamed protein product [Caenorhabditis bovis]|uniref:Uncharacterized protein n=1 Tax=Caenorhabditis bovis TaxID=2654633 RepID=A0A8S1EJ91_9PELO|nr:unnamed protein product [Caenorhabditis bovis]
MRGSSNLSASALNYLQSLEKNSAALRKGSSAKNLANRPRKPSISEIISQARRQTSLSRHNSDDYDALSESFKSSIFDEVSGRGEKVVIFSDSEGEKSPILPRGSLTTNNGAASLEQIRQLRNSIDQSLISVPESRTNKTVKIKAEDLLKKTQKKISKKETAPSRPVDEPEERKSPTMMKRSPFKKAIESESSDAESIVFDEVFEQPPQPPPKKEEAEQKTGKKSREPEPEFESETESESESSSASSDSTSESESTLESEDDSSSSSSSSSEDKSSSTASTIKKSAKSSNPVSLADYDYDFPTPKEASPEADGISESFRKLSVISEKDEEQKSESVESRKIRKNKKHKELQNCQSNLHNMMEKIVETHVKMINELNEIEWKAVNDWQQMRDRFENKKGPGMNELKRIIDERLAHKRYSSF